MLLHSPQTVVHMVTLLEEMPVQETLDAAADLRLAGYTLGHVIVNRARPVLVSAALLNGRGEPDESLLERGLAEAGLDTTLAPALARQLSEYAERQAVQAAAEASLHDIDLPIVRLPDLTPPMDLGNLFSLAEDLDVEEWHA
jgi:hypothetical protein